MYMKYISNSMDLSQLAQICATEHCVYLCKLWSVDLKTSYLEPRNRITPVNSCMQRDLELQYASIE